MISRAQKKHIKSLSQKKFRQKFQEFVVEGNKSIRDLIENGFQVKHIYTGTPDKFGSGLNATEITKKELESISFLKNPKDSLAIFSWFEKKSINTDETILILDNIQDPGNLGTIIRTADWFGVRQIVCSPDTVDVYNPKVVQASMGSIGNVNIVYTDLIGFLSEYKRKIYGTFMNGKNVFKEDIPLKSAIIIGNEANGIREEIEKVITNRISIPKSSSASAESLNAAIATAVILAKLKM